MAIPRVEREKILEAIQEFDSALAPTDEWSGWEQRGSQVWGLSHDDRYYPPKKIISIATGIPVNDFSGGPETNNYLNERGFEVVKLRQASLDSIFKAILERYDDARQNVAFSGNHEIKELFNEARRTLKDSPELKSHPNVNVVSSYGKGNWATIPWISFLDKRETATTQSGTYVVYLFEEGGNGLYVKLAQGVTGAQKEFGVRAEEVLGQKAAEIRRHCMGLAKQGFDLSGQSNLHTTSKLGKLYEASTVAAKHYPRDSIPTEAKLLEDLDALLKTYDAYVSQRDPESLPLIDTRPLALLGTWRGVRENVEAIKAKIAADGGWASWWSFPIKDEAIGRLTAPFNLYAYVGNQKIGARLRVDELKTSRGNSGIESPWPALTDDVSKGMTRSSENTANIFKTWFRIGNIEMLEHELPVSSFDIAIGLSTQENLLNQSTFGYILDLEESISGEKRISPPMPTPKTTPEISIDWLIKQTGLTRKVLEEMISSIRGDSPQIILSGPPGTGKTWVARLLAHYLSRGDEQNVHFVQFHPSYTYESFIEGLRPVTRGGSISFEVTNGLVLNCVDKMRERGAIDDPNQDYVIVIDEANRANLPKVFGELMFLFEYRQQPVRLQYSGDFQLPTNLRFVATMNTADRSIRSIDVALRRRFDVFELGPDPDILRRHYENGRQALDGLVNGFVRLNEALETDLDRHHTIGHTFFMRERMDGAALRQIWARRVYPLIEEFFFDQPDLAKEFSLEKFWPNANVG